MPLIASFSGTRAKLARAKEHFETLKGEIVKFLASDPYTFVGDFKPERGEYVAHARARDHLPAERWAILIGDLLHHLRSALDHLAWELILLNSGQPGVLTQFPIFEDRLGKRGGIRSISIEADSGGPHPSLQKFVEGVQPYERSDAPWEHPLWILAELSNEDKHRTLNLASATLEGFGLGIGTMRDIDLFFDFVGYQGPFDENTELAVWRATATGPNPEVHMNAYGSIDIAFGQGPAFGRFVIPTLEDLFIYESNIVDILISKALALI